MSEDLYRTEVRGGENTDSGIRTTAGSAEWYEPAQLPPRRSRELNASQQTTGLAFARVAQAATREAADHADEKVTIGGRELSRSDLDTMTALRSDDILAMTELNELAAVTYLKSWTVRKVDGQAVLDLPAPRTIDDLLDLPRETYDDLMTAAARIEVELRRQPGFTAESAGDPDSPTDASAD
jgi:hypothetical protein